MNFENIQMAVVRKKSDESKINISQINENNRYDEYECIVCGSEVIPVAPNGKIVGGANAKVTPHFKHLNADRCGQESFIHFWIKTEFIKTGDKFKVITDKENEYICNQIFFENTIIIGDKRYTPDATILTSCGKTIHFEFNYSNSKKIKDYIDKWKELNHIIVEVDINSTMCVFSDTIPTFKALYYEGKCFNLNSEDELYYKTIGEYKITNKDEKVLNSRKVEIEKLDWLWNKIRQTKNNDNNLEDVGKAIQAISSEECRRIVINIFSKSNCKNNILKNYVSFIKNKIDKRLKLLNLKYRGYLIKYETEIPRLIYDRIFSGIIIKFHGLDNDFPEIYQTNNYNFKAEILSDKLKSRIDLSVKDLSFTNDLLCNIQSVFKRNNKILSFKFHFKESTDYIDALCIKDYRNNTFIFYRDTDEYYSRSQIKDLYKDTYHNFINNETNYINLENINNLDVFIIETMNSYEVSNTKTKPLYEFNEIIKQDKINLTCKFFNNSFIPLLNYDIVVVTEKLNKIFNKIRRLKSKSKYDINIINKEIITDFKINSDIREILFPLIKISNYIECDNLNLIFNKKFTFCELENFIKILKIITNKEIHYKM